MLPEGRRFLLLFDIDGTLIRAHGAGRRALNRAFENLLGVENAMDGIRLDGATDKAVFRAVLERHGGGVGDLAMATADAMQTYLMHLSEEFSRPEHPLDVLPGVATLLGAASREPRMVLGLATGNLEEGARIKLRAAGLEQYFEFGGYGSDGELRADLVARAIERGQAIAKDRFGETVSLTDVIVIGDTERDVLAARAMGVCAVGVLAGSLVPDVLAASAPDMLVESLGAKEIWAHLGLSQPDLLTSHMAREGDPLPSRRRRIWSEFVPPDVLASRATIDLLRRFDLEPLIALPPQAETGEMARALRLLSSADVRVGLWPLLSDEEGYWPSRDNSGRFAERVDRALTFALGAGAKISTVAIDLEPPLAVVQSLFARGLLHATRWGLAEWARSSTRVGAAERTSREEALLSFDRIEARLRSIGIESFAAVMPPVVLDLALESGRLWQRVLRTPCVGVDWKKISPLMYSSMLEPLFPASGRDVAHDLVHEAARVLASRDPRRASISLGCVGTGKLGDETVFESPAQLARDVLAARTGGVEDLALFALDGVLRAKDPESWLLAFTEQDPVPEVFTPSLAGKFVARALKWTTWLATRVVR